MQPQIMIPKKRGLIIFTLVISIIAIVLLTLSFLLKLFHLSYISLFNLPQLAVYILLIFVAISTGRVWGHSGPGLIATPAGFEDNVSLTHFGLIEWKDIEGFQLTKFLFSKQARVFFKNYSKYEAKADFITKTTNQLNSFLIKTPMPCYYIQINYLKGNPEEIVKHLNLYLEAMRMNQ